MQGRCRPGSRERQKVTAEKCCCCRASPRVDARAFESGAAVSRATPEGGTSTLRVARLERRRMRTICLIGKEKRQERARQCDPPGDQLEPSGSAVSWHRRPKSCPPNSSHQTIFPCRPPFQSKHRIEIELRRRVVCSSLCENVAGCPCSMLSTRLGSIDAVFELCGGCFRRDDSVEKVKAPVTEGCCFVLRQKGS